MPVAAYNQCMSCLQHDFVHKNREAHHTLFIYGSDPRKVESLERNSGEMFLQWISQILYILFENGSFDGHCALATALLLHLQRFIEQGMNLFEEISDLFPEYIASQSCHIDDIAFAEIQVKSLMGDLPFFEGIPG